MKKNTMVIAVLSLLLLAFAASCSLDPIARNGASSEAITMKMKDMGDTEDSARSLTSASTGLDFYWKAGERIDVLAINALDNLETLQLTVQADTGNEVGFTPESFTVVNGKTYYAVTPSVTWDSKTYVISYKSQSQSASGSTASVIDYNLAKAVAADDLLVLNYDHAGVVAGFNLYSLGENRALKSVRVTTSGNEFPVSERVSLVDLYDGSGNLKVTTVETADHIDVNLAGASTDSDGNFYLYLSFGAMTAAAGDKWTFLVTFADDSTLTLSKTFSSEVTFQRGKFGKSGVLDYTYAVGSIGPAGGWIVYDKGTYSDGWRYLEAAPANVSVGGTTTFVFGYSRDASGNTVYTNGTTDFNAADCTSEAIGTGEENTRRLVAAIGDKTTTTSTGSTKTSNYAAKLCDDYSVNGYSDWFLPSRYELLEVYKVLVCNKSSHEIGSGGSSFSYCLSAHVMGTEETRATFPTGTSYWTSSESTYVDNGSYGRCAGMMTFDSSAGGGYSNTGGSYRSRERYVRAVRAF